MTKIQKVVALGAAVVSVALCPSGYGQDDLDDLLKELEAESKQAPQTEKQEPAPAPQAEEPAPVVEAPQAEEPAPVVAAEEPVPVVAATEEPAPVVAAEEPAPVVAAEEPAPVVEPTVAETDTEKPTVNADSELLANLEATERVRREALDAEAVREINEARVCMKRGEYDEVVRHYGNAGKLLNDRAGVKKLRKECDGGVARALYLGAIEEYKIGRREHAIEKMQQAVDHRYPLARRVLEKWLDEAKTSNETHDIADILHRKNDADYKAKRELIRRHLRRSYQYFSLRDMDSALEECEIVLKNDPSNEDAIRIRGEIEKKCQFIREKERVSARDGMIAEVDRAWRPTYAVNAAQLNESSSETVKKQAGEDPRVTMEHEILRRMKEMKLPSISFKPPATIIEAVDWFRQASQDYDNPSIPVEKRGFNFVLRMPKGTMTAAAPQEESNDFTASEDEGSSTVSGLEQIQTITASDISFYEAMNLVCESVGYKFVVNGQVVMVMPKEMTTYDIVDATYNVPESFIERVNNASEEIRTMGGAFGSSNKRASESSETEGEGQDWMAFFKELGVEWPEGSSIKHLKSLGKLYVRNTRVNLAHLEKLLDELGGQERLIEIETRFVEVSQEDLNSLGFEWLMNSDYTFDVGSRLGKALGIAGSTWGTDEGTIKTGTSIDNSFNDSWVRGSNGTLAKAADYGGTYRTLTTENSSFTHTVNPYSIGGNLVKDASYGRNVGINAVQGVPDFSKTDSFGNGMRYMSTMGNHISGESKAYNDQFLKVNAFLGGADLSMILHMLAQRSDTDLLSAPKVVTKPGENAVIKVVTEYIYPQDYDVQLQSSNSSSGNSGSSSQSAVLAVVEPQNFTMREVGVILDVTPYYNENAGGIIDLELKPQVVDEPTWKNYGMKIPFTGNSSLQNFQGIGEIFTGLAQSITAIGEIPADIKNWIITTETEAADNALGNLTKSQSENMTYYEAPMEQPWFHVRSIDSKVAITPGSTVVMGGLITEQRKAMDDKVPFLGDLPFIGRLFRSHVEQTVKRNLLIFVTGRLITPSGREIRLQDQTSKSAEVKPAPQAE